MDFTINFLVNQTPKQVFAAINNVRGWWDGEVKGSTDKLNDEFTYSFEDIHFSKQKVVEMIPDEKIVWLVTDSKINFVEDKHEWTGTKISFEVSRQASQTHVCFTHLGLVPDVECFDNCSNAWNQLVQQSLFSLITTGNGKKIF